MTGCDEFRWADAQPGYKVMPLYDSEGNVGPHFLDQIEQWGHSFDGLMEDPIFAQIIGKELEGESIAHCQLSGLASMAPNERIRNLYLKWLGFINADLQPWTTGGAIHFRPHWARVLMLALVLGESLGFSDDELEALAVAAAFHDSRRKDPYMDTGHGARAAQYYKEFCQAVGQGAACKTNAAASICFDIRVYELVRWHDRDDDLGLEAVRRVVDEALSGQCGIAGAAGDGVAFAEDSSDAKARFESLYLAFKDADGLDRVRLGEGEPDVRFLRNEEAMGLLPYAYELLGASMGLASGER